MGERSTGFATRRIISEIFLAFTVALCFASQPAAFAHESPVDHVDRTMALCEKDGRLHLEVRLQITLRMALMQFHAADSNATGSLTDAALHAALQRTAADLHRLIAIEIGGKRLAWDAAVRVSLEPGLGQRFVLSAPLASPPGAALSGRLLDDFSAQHPGHYRFVNSPEIPKIGRAHV